MDDGPITWSLTSDERETLRRRIPEAAAWASQPWPSPLTETAFRSRDLWPEDYSDTSYSWWEPPFRRIEDWIEEVSTKRARGLVEFSIEVPSLEIALQSGSILAHDLGRCAADQAPGSDSPFFDKLDNTAWDTWLLITRNVSGKGCKGPVWLSWVSRDPVAEVRRAARSSTAGCFFWAAGEALDILDARGGSMDSSHKPDGYSTVSPYLIVDGAERTIEFLKRVFGAVELRRFPGGPGKVHHAEVRIDDTVVMLADPPPGSGPVSAHVHVYIPDVDVAYRRALEAGAVSIQEPVKKEDPDRRGGVRDPGGTTWWIATRVG